MSLILGTTATWKTLYFFRSKIVIPQIQEICYLK